MQTIAKTFASEIDRLSSVTLNVKDLKESMTFYTEVWGLHVVAQDAEMVQLRAKEGEHHVLELRVSKRPGLHSITWGAPSREQIDQLFKRLTALGVRFQSEPAFDAGVLGYGCTFHDPEGRLHRVQAECETLAPLVIDSLAQGACPSKLSHVVVNVLDMQGMTDFLIQVLGFRLSDATHKMRFFRCNENHHSIALADFASVSLNHVAFEMSHWNELMFGVGRVKLAGHALHWGLGRHGPGDNIFAYFIDPNGLVVEYTAEVQQITDANWIPGTPEQWVRSPERMDQWGFSPLPSAEIKAAMAGLSEV